MQSIFPRSWRGFHDVNLNIPEMFKSTLFTCLVVKKHPSDIAICGMSNTLNNMVIFKSNLRLDQRSTIFNIFVNFCFYFSFLPVLHYFSLFLSLSYFARKTSQIEKILLHSNYQSFFPIINLSATRCAGKLFVVK